VSDLFNQTRPEQPYLPEVTAFADALEAVMGDGTHGLAEIAAGLNARRVAAGGRSNWTPEALAGYLAELANAR
jgi:hypothetical protein